MIARRTFAGGLALLSIVGTWGRVGRAEAGSLPAIGVSPQMAQLADCWEESSRISEALRCKTYYFGEPVRSTRVYCSSSDPAVVSYRETLHRMLDDAGRIFLEPSRTRSDVILKYHVMDMFSFSRPVLDDAAYIAAGGIAWHRIIEREADIFGLDLNCWWRGGNPLYAQINSDRYSALWSEVARWRSEDGRPQSMVTSAHIIQPELEVPAPWLRGGQI